MFSSRTLLEENFSGKTFSNKASERGNYSVIDKVVEISGHYLKDYEWY